MTLIEFSNLLESVCENVSHYKAEGEDFPRVVYQETEKLYYYADNRIRERRYKVDVHFYTIIEFDPILESLEDLFTDNGIPFDLVDIQYGEIPGHGGIIYYLFRCEV